MEFLLGFGRAFGADEDREPSRTLLVAPAVTARFLFFVTNGRSSGRTWYNFFFWKGLGTGTGTGFGARRASSLRSTMPHIRHRFLVLGFFGGRAGLPHSHSMMDGVPAVVAAFCPSNCCRVDVGGRVAGF